MTNILLGAAGFILVHLVDLAAIKKLPLAKPLCELSGSILIVFAAVSSAATGARLDLPGWVSVSGIFLLIVSIIGLVQSLFITLPFAKTYVKRGASGELVETGLYRLMRHPWLAFFALSMAGLAAASRSSVTVISGLVWIVLSLVLVWWQDRYIFARMFPGYAAYQRSTPMLIPTKQSLGVFWRELNKRSA